MLPFLCLSELICGYVFFFKELLRLGCEVHVGHVVLRAKDIHPDPIFDSIKQDKRFIDIVAKIGLQK